MVAGPGHVMASRSIGDRLPQSVLLVACQRDGTTWLPRAWDHLEVLVSIVGLVGGVNADTPGGSVSLPVGGAFDDQGVRV